jgi:hypothetical protein
MSAARKSRSAARTAEAATIRPRPVSTSVTVGRKLIRHEAPDRGEPIGEALESRETAREAPDAGEGSFHTHLHDF